MTIFITYIHLLSSVPKTLTNSQITPKHPKITPHLNIPIQDIVFKAHWPIRTWRSHHPPQPQVMNSNLLSCYVRIETMNTGCLGNSGVSQLQALLVTMHSADSNRKSGYHVLLSKEAKVRGRGLRRSMAVGTGVRDTKCIILASWEGERTK